MTQSTPAFPRADNSRIRPVSPAVAFAIFYNVRAPRCGDTGTKHERSSAARVLGIDRSNSSVERRSDKSKPFENQVFRGGKSVTLGRTLWAAGNPERLAKTQGASLWCMKPLGLLESTCAASPLSLQADIFVFGNGGREKPAEIPPLGDDQEPPACDGKLDNVTPTNRAQISSAIPAGEVIYGTSAHRSR